MTRLVTHLAVITAIMVAGPFRAAASPGFAGLAEKHAVIAALAYEHAHEHAHADGTPCPDGGETPCGTDCACACCHGNSAAKAGVPPPPRIADGGPPRTHPIAKPSDLHPIELVRRVFHPPR